MNRIFGLIAVLMLAIYLCGCEGSDKDKVVITLGDNGKAVPVMLEDTFEIQLEGNPSTGYAWQQTAGNDAIVKQIEEPYFLQRGSAAGGGGIFVFKMQAVSLGYTTLKFEYMRPFSTELIVDQTFEVIIAVREKVSE